MFDTPQLAAGLFIIAPNKLPFGAILIAPYGACQFCLPGGPNSIIEVFLKTPRKYTTDAIVVSGTMNLLKDDPSGFYYRMIEAAEVR